MFVGSVQIISDKDRQSKFQTFTLLSGRHVEGGKELHQQCGSILGNVNLRKAFRRVSDVWENAET